jgi:uncharacterized protein
VLSPVVLLLGWANLKETAAVSALFIWVNSVSGLLGAQTQGIAWNEQMFAMIGITFMAGLLGAYFGVNRFKIQTIKYALGVVLLIASIKLVWV